VGHMRALGPSLDRGADATLRIEYRQVLAKAGLMICYLTDGPGAPNLRLLDIQRMSLPCTIQRCKMRRQPGREACMY
jgi:hypothetical protein